MQRVADNAKRIRQSPRYAHGAAAAAVKKEHFEENYGWFGEETEGENSRHVENERGKARRLENYEGAKMPELPSVVEDEYGLLIERNGKSSRRRNRTGRPDFVEEHGNREPAVKVESDVRGKEQASPSLIRPVLSKSASAHSGSLDGTTSSKDVKRTSLEWISYTRPSRNATSLENNTGITALRRHPFHATRTGKTWENGIVKYQTTQSMFDTHLLWVGQYSTERVLPPEILTQDIDTFFQTIDIDAFPRMPTQHAHSIADGLLRLSLESGSLEHVRSLLLWKLATKVLCIQDLHNTTAAFRHIAEHADPETTLQFYTDLFTLSTYQEASKAEKLRVSLRLHAEALKLDTLHEHSALHETFADRINIPSNLCRASGALELLERECRQLIDDCHLPAAVELWCMIMRSRKAYIFKQQTKLDNDLFDAAIKAGHLSLCARMLRAKNHSILVDDGHQKDALIKVCFEQGAMGMLQSLFDSADAGGLREHGMLSPQSCAYLCRCFAGTNERFAMFNTYYHRLPLELRTSVAEASVTDAAFALKADWKATRNLDLVREKYERALERLSQDINADARLLEVAMIEIELSANQPAEAIASLSIMNRISTDGSVVTLIALALAKQKNWLAFGRLFETLKQDRPTWSWTPTMKRAYNNALHLFSRSHTAEQLSDFVSMSINELRLRPNQSTWEILLSSLVSKRAIALLKYWIKLSDTSGKKLDLDGKFAAALMKSWYLDFRHSHVLVMWLCRNLVEAAPSLQDRALLDIAREAIGFDLRKLRGVNAPWMGPVLRAREALCQDANGTVPKPGYVWNGKLYDSGRLVTVEELLAQRQALHADDDLPLLLDSQNTSTEREFGKDLHANDELQTLLDSRTTATVRERGTGSAVETGIPYFGLASDATDQNEVKSTEVMESSEAPVIRNVAPMQEGDATTTSISEPRLFVTSLENLRPLYEAELSDLQESDTAIETSEPEPLERRMIMQFSLRQYDSVIKLYHESLDAIGLPASPIVLEVSLEASLRSSDDRSEAERIVSAARDAGMNVTCAMGPLLINQISNTPLEDMTSATALRSDVLKYYRNNELNGLHVKHHVATHAAHKLIQAGFAQHGINLLSTILKSSWFLEKPLDIAAMSVWLSGYAALGHVQGMHWVIEEVLNQGLGIDQAFLQSLKSARRPVRRYDNGTLGFGRQERKTTAYIRQWFSVCSQRRLAQMQESKVFGRKLVNLLASAANGETVRTGTRRRRAGRVRRLPGKTSRTELDLDPFVEHTVPTVGAPTTDKAKENATVRLHQAEPAAAGPKFEDPWALAADETKEKTETEPVPREHAAAEPTVTRWVPWVGETK